jgi:RNA polymerase sigma-54 factor
MSGLSEDQRIIGAHIIGNLNEDGYLDSSIDEIAGIVGCCLEDVRLVIETVQSFDPVGVAASNMRECLLVQVRFHNLQGTVVESIIADHLWELEENRYDQIARALSVSTDQVLAAVSVLRNMDPRPGRAFSSDETIYITPDIYIVRVGDDYEIIQNEDGLPKLRISSYYKELLRSKNSLSENAKGYIQDKLRAASWLIKSIHQRQRTIYRVTESIARFQRAFLDKGVTHLRPLVLRDVAEDINMHESTVSRVTTNKYVHTPQGLFELKYFFNSSINSIEGDAIASESVKEHIRKIVKEENPNKPYSDQELAEMMRDYNVRVARRTVAKYRESMGILPSRKRRRAYR